jgi:hypothetical protein
MKELLIKRIDVYIEEFKALREEELLEIRHRHTIRMVVWTIVGAVFGFALSGKEATFKVESLLSIPVITFVFSLFWAEAQGRIESFHAYIRDHIAPKVRDLFDDINTPVSSDGRLLGWENSKVCRTYREDRKLARRLFDVITFVVVPAVAIMLVHVFACYEIARTIAYWETVLILASGVLIFCVDRWRAR